MTTTLTSSTSQVSLASYGTGNPFYVNDGTSIVSSGTGQIAIYGDASQSWTLSNAGTVGGGTGQSPSGTGGDGIELLSDASTVTNTGTIAGGDGGGGGYAYYKGPGGTGISILGANDTITNSGLVAGGSAGGAGIVMADGGTVANSGTIKGGGSDSVPNYGFLTSPGGAGILISGSANGMITNSGIISGSGMSAAGVSIGGFGTIVNQAGASIFGGNGGEGEDLTSFPGGYGIVLAAGGSVNNAGTITGGRSGYREFTIGVWLQGSADSTVVNSGTISGGEGYDNAHGQAVQFGSGNDRLILYGGSVLVGGADGGSGSNTLELAGGAPGTIGSIGSTISDFQTVLVDAGSHWSTPDVMLGGDNSTLTVDGRLTVADTVGLYGTKATIAATGALTAENMVLSGSAALTMQDTFISIETLNEGTGSRIGIGAGNTLTVTDGGQLAGAIAGGGTLALQGGVTTMTAGATARVANLTLSDSAVVNVNGNVACVGKLTEGAGTKITVRTGEMLALTGTIAGSGAIDIGVGSTLRIAGTAGAAESIAFGANTGKLTLINPKRFRSKITHLAAGDKIDIANANFAFNKNETLTFVENAKKTEGTLTLKNGANVVALHLFGQHVAQGFHIAGDGHGGTMITYQPPAAHAPDHMASGGGG